MTLSSFIALSDAPLLTVLQTTTNGTPANADSLYGGFNLGTHVNDNFNDVQANRAKLLAQIQQQHPSVNRICWLNQVHGNDVYHVTDHIDTVPVSADAHITTLADTALAIMTADCVPVMISSQDGEVIGAIHAGWQGLAKDVIANTVQKMAHQISIDNQDFNADELAQITNGWQAWIGAAIGQDSYEVDSRVKEGVLSILSVDEATATQLFRPNPDKAGHYFADLTKVAELQLNACGINQVYQSGLDSYRDERFYSYRRQSQAKLPSTGRMATLIIKPSN